MNDEQVEQLLSELRETRKSFEAVIKTVKWTRVNTFVQYCLIAVVFFMLIIGVRFYLDNRRDDCERSNETRVEISASLDANALAIGIALATATNSDPQSERFQVYLDAYGAQAKPDILEPREC